MCVGCEAELARSVTDRKRVVNTKKLTISGVSYN